MVCLFLCTDFKDIAYNYLVGGDGRAYVGRGWGVKAAYMAGHSNDYISIGAMGQFHLEEPSKKLVDTIANLLDCAVNQVGIQRACSSNKP